MKEKKNDTNFAEYLVRSIIVFSVACVVIPKIIDKMNPYIEKLISRDESGYEDDEEWEPDIVKNYNKGE